MYVDTMIKDLSQATRSAVGFWGLGPDTPVRLLTVSENATFIAEPEGEDPIILRVHRPGYHTLEEIKSELRWIEALRTDSIVTTPKPLKGKDGTPLALTEIRGEIRPIAAFSYMPGQAPSADESLAEGFRKLGDISARLHRHARTWSRPSSFIRKTWRFETMLGDRPHWGRWQDSLGLTRDGEGLLGRVCDVINDKLTTFGDAPDRFGLIHADLRLANLLVNDDHLGVIDFDDCGFGWYGYDFAAAISFLETNPVIPELQAAWLEGYRTVAPFSAEEEAMMSTFIILRRLLLTAWIASHAETPTAEEAGGAAFTEGTLTLAERYLTEV